MRWNRIIPILFVLFAFTAYSVWVIATHGGYLGFVWLALRWHRHKRVFELEYNAKWLRAAAERIEQLMREGS